MSSLPVPKRPFVHRKHGRARPDPYHWLRDRDDPSVIEHLKKENAHSQTWLKDNGGDDLKETLAKDMLHRIVEDDSTPPLPNGAYRYYTRTERNQPYPIHCRRKDAPDAPEEIILNVNALAEGQDYIRIYQRSVSRDHRHLAWLQDDDGSEHFRLRVKDLSTGEMLDYEVADTKWTLTWAADSRTIFYARADAAKRPYQIWRHDIHSPPEDDVLVFEELNERYFVSASTSSDWQRIFVTSASKISSEIHFLHADRPEQPPQMLWPRQENVEAYATFAGDRYLIRTNLGAQTFRILTVPAQTPQATPTEWLAADPDITLTGMAAFNDHLVVGMRADGNEQFQVFRRADNATHRIEFPDPSYMLGAAGNYEYDTENFFFSYSSPRQPNTVYQYNMETRERVLLHENPVGGEFDKDNFIIERVMVVASDGEAIPLTITRRRDVVQDGNRPVLMFGYGSYGSTYDAYFSNLKLPLLDRGVIVCIAHIRGGGEMGRRWYDHGKKEHKMNTFTDFIACAEHLVASGWTRPERLAISGASAGGLLMGAVTNMRPDLFNAVVAQVPFVDVVSTMLDDSLPLTVTEYDEWGDPNDVAVFERMMSYSPYDNVTAQAYPAMLITAGLNDPRVSYWEPAKWAARLRERSISGAPVLLKIHLGAGHGGKSGRYGIIEDYSWIFAFVLKQLGVE
ncbi:MAG: S9 family peptidase [Myxococcota bacterium]